MSEENYFLSAPWVERFVAWAVTAEDDLDFHGAEVPGRVQAMVRAMWPVAAERQDAINSGAVCRSGCATQDHGSYAECLKAAAIQIGKLT